VDQSDNQIREKAKLRLSQIFRLPLANFSSEVRFGDDLKASFVSDFRRNELDRVNDDIRDVADQSITKELALGKRTIRTVGDYCEYMVLCSKSKPNDVQRVLDGGDDPARGSGAAPA
jgi:hypothetical protein